MAEQGLHKIESLRRRWVAYRVAADVLWAIAIGVAADGLLFYLFGASLIWSQLVTGVALSILLAVHRPWQLSNEQVAAFLNRQYPQLEECTALVLLPAAELNILQQLALHKTESALENLSVGHQYSTKRLGWPLLALLVAIVFAGVMSRFSRESVDGIRSKDQPEQQSSLPPEKVLAQIDEVQVAITPPAYTRKAKRTQDRFNLNAEEGAMVNWQIKTNVAVKQMLLIFNDRERIVLKSNSDDTEWSAQRMVSKPGFYQVSVDGKLSELYQVQVIKDAPPVIQVRSPKQYTYIDAGETPQVNINASLTDDYGIAGAQIIATVAKGRGEGVKFKEYKLNFNTLFAGQAQYNTQKLVSLPALNMEPGDELYFYVQAKDSHNQESRTDVFTVAIQDTAELLSMDGVLSGANLKPEFFRSERQIIIDAEQLIKDKDSISVEKFNARSNDLGIDQKLLRLRYGKFLGEEDEVVEGPKGASEAADPADFSNATKILKEYTDDHDKAEDAQFFEPAIKAQLKATLSEMWKAELQLRLYKPQAALPFAYKALRLLKDLQQKSRSYVAKTAYNPPPLKPEKRLSGELDKIIQPVNQLEMKPVTDRYEALKQAVAVLEQLKIKPGLTAAGNRTLQVANQQLSLQASAQPGTYLPALAAMRRILSAGKVSFADVDLVERAIQKTLAPAKIAPVPAQQSADMGLSRQYYKNLKLAKP